MHQNMSLGSNGVDRVRSLLEIPTRLRGTNFSTSSACLAPSFVSKPNCSKCTQIVRNAPKHEFSMQWGGSGAFVAKNFDATSWKQTFCNSSAHFAVDRVHLLRKIQKRLRGTNFYTSSARFPPSFVRQLNGPEYTQMVRNSPKH